MSELDELQKNTLESWKQARMQDLIAHLQVLSDNIDKAMKREKKAGIIYFCSWLVWMGGNLLDAWLKTDKLFFTLGWFVFLFGLLYHNHVERALNRSFGEYLSAIKVLEILGVIDPINRPGVKNKKKRLTAFIEMVKQWAIKKQKAKEEVYQPA